MRSRLWSNTTIHLRECHPHRLAQYIYGRAVQLPGSGRPSVDYKKKPRQLQGQLGGTQG